LKIACGDRIGLLTKVIGGRKRYEEDGWPQKAFRSEMWKTSWIREPFGSSS